MRLPKRIEKPKERITVKTDDGRICCGDCANATPMTEKEYLNHEGKPFLCTCPFLPEGWQRQLMSHRWYCRDYEPKKQMI